MNPLPDKKRKLPSFFLEKWFLDVVTDEGEVFIFNAAKMNWHRFRIPYKSFLHIPVSGKPEQKTRFYNVKLPVKQDVLISWTDKLSKTEGNWRTNALPLQAQLLKTEEGNLQWNCFQPSSSANVKIDDRTISGMGYAEQLILTIEPWKIQVKELRWGRFVSGKHYLVWIEIRADKNKQWIWHDGEEINDGEITNEYVTIPSKNIRLVLTESRPAEINNNIQRVLAKLTRLIPGFGNSVPAKFLLSEEHKWVSRGHLYKDGLPESKGWVIHERVDFKY